MATVIGATAFTATTTITSGSITGTITAPVASALVSAYVAPALSLTGTTVAFVGWSASAASSTLVTGNFTANTSYYPVMTVTAAANYTIGASPAFTVASSSGTAQNSLSNGVATVIGATAFTATAAPTTTKSATGGTTGAGTGWALSGSETLVWAKVAVTASWPVASSTCTALGNGWRMPKQGELSGLYNTVTAKNAAIAAGWTMSYTWSSELSATGYRYFVDLHDGTVYDGNPDSSTFSVSCVH